MGVGYDGRTVRAGDARTVDCHGGGASLAQVHRICAACGKDSPLEAQYCPHCGQDSYAGLPMRQGSSLPMVVTKAAWPVLATAGTLAARVIWKLLRERILSAANITVRTEPAAPVVRVDDQPIAQPIAQSQRSRRALRIRTTWAVGDANGIQRQGYTDQTIEFDD